MIVTSACRAVEDAAQGVGRSHAQIVVAVGRDDRPVDVGDVIDEVFDLRAVLAGQAVAVVSGMLTTVAPAAMTASITRAVFRIGARRLRRRTRRPRRSAWRIHRPDGRFDDLFGRRAQFVVDMLGDTPIPVWMRLCWPAAGRRRRRRCLFTARVSAQIVGAETAFEISSTS